MQPSFASELITGMARSLTVACFFLAIVCGVAGYSMLETGCVAAQVTAKK
jgi:hypothetical protein